MHKYTYTQHSLQDWGPGKIGHGRQLSGRTYGSPPKHGSTTFTTEAKRKSCGNRLAKDFIWPGLAALGRQPNVWLMAPITIRFGNASPLVFFFFWYAGGEVKALTWLHIEWVKGRCRGEAHGGKGRGQAQLRK